MEIANEMRRGEVRATQYIYFTFSPVLCWIRPEVNCSASLGSRCARRWLDPAVVWARLRRTKEEAVLGAPTSARPLSGGQRHEETQRRDFRHRVGFGVFDSVGRAKLRVFVRSLEC